MKPPPSAAREVSVRDEFPARRGEGYPGTLTAKVVYSLRADGSLAIEYEANPKDPTADVKACLEYLKEQIKQVG